MTSLRNGTLYTSFREGVVDPESLVQSPLEVPQLPSGKVRILSRASDHKVLSSCLCHMASHSWHIMHRSRWGIQTSENKKVQGLEMWLDHLWYAEQEKDLMVLHSCLTVEKKYHREFLKSCRREKKSVGIGEDGLWVQRLGSGLGSMIYKLGLLSLHLSFLVCK